MAFELSYASRRRKAPVQQHAPVGAAPAGAGGAPNQGGAPAPANVPLALPAERLGPALVASLGFPIGAIAVAVALLMAVSINDARTIDLAAATPAGVRAIIQQYVVAQMSDAHLKEVLGPAPAGPSVCAMDAASSAPSPQSTAAPKSSGQPAGTQSNAT